MVTIDPPLRPRRHRWLPFEDPSRRRRLVKVLGWLAGIALIVAALELLGIDVSGWFSSMWDAVTGVGLGYLMAGWSLQTLQTTLTALGWSFILRAGYPRALVPYLFASVPGTFERQLKKVLERPPRAKRSPGRTRTLGLWSRPSRVLSLERWRNAIPNRTYIRIAFERRLDGAG